MALTISNKVFAVFGNKRAVICEVDFDSSYPSGGEALAPSDVGLSAVDFVLPSPKDGYLFEYDYSNQKLKALYPRAAIADTLSASVDPGATTVTSTAANGNIITLSGNAGVAAGPGEEVPDATDLSSVTGVKVLMIGR